MVAMDELDRAAEAIWQVAPSSMTGSLPGRWADLADGDKAIFRLMARRALEAAGGFPGTTD